MSRSIIAPVSDASHSEISAREAERIWLAAELHDGPLQRLAAIGYVVDRTRQRVLYGDTVATLDALDRIRDELTAVINSLRRLTAELRPPALDELGLDRALRDYVRRFRNEWHIATSLETSLASAQLDSFTQVVVYRVVQEALTNARKHAAATQIRVEVSVSEHAVTVRVEDNGSGFDLDRTEQTAATGHYGLSVMRERVEGANGTWRVTSARGLGTSIWATLPLRNG